MEVDLPVPLYELVLRFDDREEIRFTDRPLSVGEILQMDYRDWQVVSKRAPSEVQARAAFPCELAEAQRARAEKLLADDAERRERPRLPPQTTTNTGKRPLSPTTVKGANDVRPTVRSIR